MSCTFYVANATPYQIRVKVKIDGQMRDNNQIKHRLYDRINIPIIDIPISRGHYSTFRGTNVQIEDNVGNAFYASKPTSNKSLIVTYPSSSHGYSAINYAVLMSKEITSDENDDESIWTSVDGSNNKVSPDGQINLCQFHVANGSQREIELLCGRNDRSQILHNEQPNEFSRVTVPSKTLSLPINTTMLAIGVERKTIWHGFTALFSDRAIIVSADNTIHRSIPLKPEAISEDAWTSEHDNCSHYPNIFWVANASDAAIKVYTSTTTTCDEIKHGRSMELGESIRFRGHYLKIVSVKGNTVYNREAPECVSVIVKGPDTGDHILSGKLDLNILNTDNIWQATDGEDYNPRRTYEVYNMSSSSVYVMSSISPITGDTGGQKLPTGGRRLVFGKYLRIVNGEETINRTVPNVGTVRLVNEDRGTDVECESILDVKIQIQRSESDDQPPCCMV